MNNPSKGGAGASHPLARLADEIVEQYGAELLRIARRYSACASDADDAYQRAIEILLTKAPSDDPGRLRAWLGTVVRNEALLIRRERQRVAAQPGENAIDELPGEELGPDERVVADERLRHRREALMRLSADQLRCLLLLADGHGYRKICSITGFTYSKVNWCLTEGRRALRDRLEKIESGSECRRLAGKLSRYADGVADRESIGELEPHLANCLACQATLRAFRTAPREASTALPLGLAALASQESPLRQQAERIASTLSSTFDRAVGQTASWLPSSETSAVRKVAAASAIAAALAGGGVIAGEVTTSGRQAVRAQLTAPAARAAESTSPLPATPGTGPSGTAGPADETDHVYAGSAEDIVQPGAGNAAQQTTDDQTQGDSLRDPTVFGPATDADSSPVESNTGNDEPPGDLVP